jgi:hypothetical protein
MITLKDLNVLIAHLHHAGDIFTTEAAIEERKYKDVKKVVIHDMRSPHAPRNEVLHHKAELVTALEKNLLKECTSITVAIEENTIYAARELITESAYPWINRRELPLHHIEELMGDETFIPFSHGLEGKKKVLLASPLDILALPVHIQSEIEKYLETHTSPQKNDVRATVADIVFLDRVSLTSIFGDREHSSYNTKLLLFRLYTLGLIERM